MIFGKVPLFSIEPIRLRYWCRSSRLKCNQSFASIERHKNTQSPRSRGRKCYNCETTLVIKAPPQIRTRPIRASGSSCLRFRCPLLSATVALTRLLMTLSSSRVSQWQFRRPTPPLATHRLPRVGFPAFQRYYEGATTSSVHFNGLIAFGHRYLLVLSSFAHTRR